MAGTVDMTAVMRSAHTAARGSSTRITVTIRTDIRICMKYDRNAIREPTCIWPSSISIAPNQITATLDTLMINVVMGSISACQRPTASAVSDSAWLASANRACSSGSRANARMTLMPDNCSRSTRLMPSISRCMARNRGSRCLITQ